MGEIVLNRRDCSRVFFLALALVVTQACIQRYDDFAAPVAGDAADANDAGALGGDGLSPEDLSALEQVSEGTPDAAADMHPADQLHTDLPSNPDSAAEECGDGQCSGAEQCNSCPADCGCEGGRICFAAACCLPDCSASDCGSDGCGGSCGECAKGECLEGLCPAMCGDGECAGQEKCNTCVLDCGPCGFQPTAEYCLNNHCLQLRPTGASLCYSAEGEVPCDEIGGKAPPLCGDDEANPYCGQDAQYAVPLPGFEVVQLAGDKVTLDPVTGLMWQHVVPDSYPTCSGNSRCNYQQGFEYCAQLELAGFDDWRLPTPAAASSLAHLGLHEPAIDSDAFPHDNDGSGSFWLYSGLPDNIEQTRYRLHVVDSEISVDGADVINFVRCVRGGPALFDSLSGTRFQPLAEGSVLLDVVTGLQWATGASIMGDWQQGLAHCEQLVLAGEDDWRLPNRAELFSLMSYRDDFGHGFPDPGSVTYWASTTRKSTAKDAWYVWPFGGTAMASIKDLDRTIICVRGPEP